MNRSSYLTCISYNVQPLRDKHRSYVKGLITMVSFTIPFIKWTMPLNNQRLAME
ncbi:unnamed protein product [Linum tenue]|uniref:Uncharacterized protein n=1 Tax=Linum tenue TaxID=586396 RepID=A0AAV0LJ64_9ROSI|nr:unnamed protein product [Linum tenue]CAI0385755.1 unnamed protein product [Linum tenue]CAI0434230.1 unnamed protein product [Linum tenue]CAI0453777.1 unnamed protein product [Linum tenue]CAI0453779.1 unnamed protein product [Linum tenue]